MVVAVRSDSSPNSAQTKLRPLGSKVEVARLRDCHRAQERLLHAQSEYLKLAPQLRVRQTASNRTWALALEVFDGKFVDVARLSGRR